MSQCRVCASPINAFMSFGEMPIANGFLKKEQFPQEYYFELATAYCENCHMFQLINQPPPVKMFHENYAFFSQTSKHMCLHFKQFANEILSQVDSKSFVVELGSNDGIFLQHFAKKNVKHLGIEPSKNVAELAQKNGIETVNEFFDLELAKTIVKQHGHANFVTAANVMCHIPHINEVAAGIATLLDENGILIFEDPYLGDVLQKTSYDQIYDEHVFLFHVKSIQYLFSQVNMEVIDVEPQNVHGGSMRYYIAKRGKHPISTRVYKAIETEESLGLDKPITYQKFKQQCENSKTRLNTLLKYIQDQNKTVAGYAATSKSTTVLNYCDIGPDLLPCIYDTTPIKQGKYSPRMHIPIKPYTEFTANLPDYALLFAWNHYQEIMIKEKQFMQQGGQFILYVPDVFIQEKVLNE